MEPIPYELISDTAIGTVENWGVKSVSLLAVKQNSMSAWGQKRKSRPTILMSVKPPKADVARRQWHFRFVPLPEVRR